MSNQMPLNYYLDALQKLYIAMDTGNNEYLSIKDLYPYCNILNQIAKYYPEYRFKSFTAKDYALRTRSNESVVLYIPFQLLPL
jgi:hypothetical protein